MVGKYKGCLFVCFCMCGLFGVYVCVCFVEGVWFVQGLACDWCLVLCVEKEREREREVYLSVCVLVRIVFSLPYS